MATELLGKSIAFDPASHPKNVRRLNLRVELHVITSPVPNVARVAEQIVHLIDVPFHGTKLLNRNIDKRVLFAMRIEIDDDQDDVVARGGHLPVKNDRVVVSVIELQIIFELKRSIRLPDLIQARDPI